MTHEKSTQINTSKQEGNIVSDWLHHCCTLDNGAAPPPPTANLKTAGKPGGDGVEKGKSTGLGLWVLTAAMPLLLPVHHNPLPC